MATGRLVARTFFHTTILGIVCAICCAPTQAQNAAYGPWEQLSADEAYPDDEPDITVGRLIDSLFEPAAPESHVPEAISQALGRKPYRGAAQQSNLRGQLVRNPDTDNGHAPFVLVDRYGGIQRYIEPVATVDLQAYEGEIVGVRRDTGDTLLASQLDLPRTLGNSHGLQLTGHEEPIPAGELIPDPADDTADTDHPLILPEGIDPIYLDDEPSIGGCPQCGGLAMHGPDCGRAVRGGRHQFYAQGEYLIWAMDGMDTPPLVVQGDTDGNQNFTNAQIIYGNDDILTQGRSGARLRLGVWLGGGPWALEGEYLGLGSISSRFTAGGDGVTLPFIGRPIIDATTGLNAVEDVSFPGIQGNVTVDADSEFQSGGVWFRRSLCSFAGCQDSYCDDITCDSCVDCGTGVNGCVSGLCSRWSSRCGRLFNRGTRRIDFLFGLRSTRLDENLNISEDLQTTDTLPTTFQVSDRFSTTNEFTGFELGYVWGWQNQRWSIDLLNRVAIGGTHQQVDIRGSTVQNTGAGPVTGPGGLLALPSNIDSYTRDELSVIPEFGATLGFALTKRLRLTAGYTFIYWSRVARPGDQIDLEVNPGSLPFATTPSTIPARPQFVFRDTDIWIQGLNFGADYTW
ncbi:MAG: BBP7 family outer membrane beta-barrel protein [Pirellulales bacterium]